MNLNKFSKKNILSALTGGLLLLLSTGCATKECNIGSAYSMQHDKCVVTNTELKAVVSSVACVGDKCKTVVIDERNREFTIDTTDKVKVGDKISLILYTNPLLNSDKNEVSLKK